MYSVVVVLFEHTPIPYVLALYVYLYQGDITRFLHPWKEKHEWDRVVYKLRLSSVPPVLHVDLSFLPWFVMSGFMAFVTFFVNGIAFQVNPMVLWIVSLLVSVFCALVGIRMRLGPFQYVRRKHQLKYPRLGTRVKGLVVDED
jgi:hypothetical protein